MNLNNRELATLLAALRYWQRKVGNVPGREWIRALPEAEIFGDETPLDEEEIDALCERLNAPPPQPSIAAQNRMRRDSTQQEGGAQ